MLRANFVYHTLSSPSANPPLSRVELIASSLSKITRDIEIIKKDFSSLVNGNAFIKIVSYTPESAEIEDCEKIEENFKKKIIDRFSFF